MTIEDILEYFCGKYPLPHELSKARITKMVYLADWESCLRHGRQLTGIQWYFHNFGPYVEDVIEAARRSPNLDVVESENLYGDAKQLIKCRPNVGAPSLDRNTQSILDNVILETKSLYWAEFIKYVYATPPIANSTRYSSLDLVKFARSLAKA